MFNFFRSNVITTEDDLYNHCITCLEQTKQYTRKEDTISHHLITVADLVSFQCTDNFMQREEDVQHVNTIKDGLINSQELYHPIILAHVKPLRSISILDGQHRYKAFQLLPSTLQQTIHVQVDVRHYDHTDLEYVRLDYNRINTAKGRSSNELKQEDKAGEICVNCIKLFQYKNQPLILDKECKRKHHNSMCNSTKFKQELNKRLHKIPSVTEAVKMIQQYNNEMCKNDDISYKHLTDTILDECEERRFFLGVDFPLWMDRVFTE